jgi:hypothetical protein
MGSMPSENSSWTHTAGIGRVNVSRETQADRSGGRYQAHARVTSLTLTTARPSDHRPNGV